MTKRIVCLSLCAVLLFGTVSCGRLQEIPVTDPSTETETQAAAETVEETLEEAGVIQTVNCYGVPLTILENDYQELVEPEEYTSLLGRRLTRENINAFPVKRADMTTAELRELCVSFLKFAKTAVWIPDEDFFYIRNKSGSKDQMYGGEVYGGLPYIGNGSGNVYRLMDYMDENGVVDMSEASKHPLLFGNQCSIGAYWGWARVVNSADYDWTFNMVQSRGFLRVGPYTYTDSISSFSEENTAQICEKNGEQVMFQSYAAMLPADGLISSHPAGGHVVMCSSVPHVVKNGDGTINGEESYLYITDQHQRWVEKESECGVTYEHKNYIDRKLTFAALFKGSNVPFTFAELQGTDPVEETVCSFAHEGESITVERLRKAEVTANYGISDVYAYVKDADGKILFYKAERASKAGKFSLTLELAVFPATFDRYADGKHKVEVVCQLGTGERLSLYEGTLVQ